MNKSKGSEYILPKEYVQSHCQYVIDCVLANKNEQVASEDLLALFAYTHVLFLPEFRLFDMHFWHEENRTIENHKAYLERFTYRQRKQTSCLYG